MTQGNQADVDTGWHAQTGVAEDTVRVTLVCKERHRKQWDEEASEEGFRNRSKYLQTLIAEARAYRQNEIHGPHQSEQRIQQLESEIDRLQNELEHERKKAGGRPTVDDVDFLERFLAENYQPLPEILKDIVESGVLNSLIRKRVEDRLYFLAEQNRVEYERGWGWKLADEAGGDQDGV